MVSGEVKIVEVLFWVEAVVTVLGTGVPESGFQVELLGCVESLGDGGAG